MKLFISCLLMISSSTTLSQDHTTREDWAQLKKYAAENKKLKPPGKKEQRIVFMGNSITEFWKSDRPFFSSTYINRGISGQTTAQMLMRFKQDVITLKPYVVVILGGINDIAQNQGHVTLEQTFNNISAMAALAKKNNIKVILSSVLPAEDFYWKPGLQPALKIKKLNAMIKSYCLRNKLYYVNYYSAMVDQRGGLQKIYSEDGVHPNIRGYKVMEPLVQKAIKATIGSEPTR